MHHTPTADELAPNSGNFDWMRLADEAIEPLRAIPATTGG